MINARRCLGIVSVPLDAMGQIGAEDKQLPGAEQQRRHAHHQHVAPARSVIGRGQHRQGEPQTQQADHLPLAEVASHEGAVPTPSAD